MAELKIYTKTGCPFCEKALKHYREEGVDFVEINTSEDEQARQYVAEEFGADRVPIIVEDEELVQIGFAGGG